MAAKTKKSVPMPATLVALAAALGTDPRFQAFGFESQEDKNRVLQKANGEWFETPTRILRGEVALEANGFPVDQINSFFDALEGWINSSTVSTPAVEPKKKKSKDRQVGGFEALLSKLARKMGADDVYEALEMLAHNPRDLHAQAQWRKYAGDERLLVEGSTTGSIDKEATRRALEARDEIGQAPKRIDGKLLLNLGELLQKVYVADPFSGRPITGDGEILGIDQYTWEGFPGIQGLTLAKAQEHPLLLLAAFARSENMVRDPAQMMGELRSCFRGASELPQLSSLRTSLLGTFWASVYEAYERDQRTGGARLTAAKAKLQCTLAPNPRPASSGSEQVNTLTLLFGGATTRGQRPDNW